MSENTSEEVKVKWYNTKKFRVALSVTTLVIVGVVLFAINSSEEEPEVKPYEPDSPEQLEQDLLELLELEKMEDEVTREMENDESTS